MDWERFTAHLGYLSECKEEDTPRAFYQFWLAQPTFVSLYTLAVVSLFVYALIK